MTETLIELKNLKTYFTLKRSFLGIPRKQVQAVNDVNLDIRKGENLGLAGESGCGKSTLGWTMLRLIPATSGKILFDGNEIQDLNFSEMKPYRAAMQMVFQQPQSSLDPKMTVSRILAEAIRICPDIKKTDYLDRAAELMKVVDLRPEHLFRYPHEYSGGQQQRICIARALATDPTFIVFDEATSALDVSVQAQILHLMNKLRKKLNLTYLFISHDLSVLEQVCQRIAIMYAGRIVEIQRAENLFSSPRHPYTKLLRDSIPIADPGRKQVFLSIEGEPPNLSDPPDGCGFHPRCSYAEDICRREKPEIVHFGEGESVCCHRQKELYAKQALK